MVRVLIFKTIWCGEKTLLCKTYISTISNWICVICDTWQVLVARIWQASGGPQIHCYNSWAAFIAASYCLGFTAINVFTSSIYRRRRSVTIFCADILLFDQYLFRFFRLVIVLALLYFRGHSRRLFHVFFGHTDQLRPHWSHFFSWPGSLNYSW